MTQDGIEVAEFIRKRLHKSKIGIVGVSWVGSGSPHGISGS